MTAPDAHPDLRAQRALVVDDDSATRTLVADTLELAGYIVDAVPGVDEGNFALGSGAYDVVVLDLSLPDGSGMDLIKTTRITQIHGARVVILTGHQEDVFRRRAQNKGADVFLTKPFSPDELMTACEPSRQHA